MLPKPEDLKTSQKGTILVGVPLVVGSILLAIMCALIWNVQEETKREAYFKALLFHQQMTDALLSEMMSITYQSVMLKSDGPRANPLNLIHEEVNEQFRILNSLSQQDKTLQTHVRAMQETADSGMKTALKVGSLSASEIEIVPVHIMELYTKLRRFFDEELKNRKAFVTDLEKKQKDAPVSAEQWSIMLYIFMFLALLINIWITFASVVFFGRSMSQRINVLVENSILLAAGQPLNPQISGKDEIAQLDAVFHSMARELRTAKRKEQAIVDNTIDLICSLDQHDRFTAVNNASVKVMGYEPDELLGRRVADITVKEDLASTMEYFEACQQGKSQGSFENRIRRKDGVNVDMLWSAIWSKPMKLYFCVVHDITRRRRQEELLQESEKKVRLILENMPVGVSIGNDRGLIESTNRKIEQMFDYSENELLEQPFNMLFQNLPEIKEGNFMEWLQERASQEGVELEAKTKSGKSFPCQVVISNFFFHGEIKPLIIIADISSRKEVERMKQEFVAMVSHDLRAPLTTLNITLQFLKGGTLGELNKRGKERVENMESEVERLIGLINNLLDLEKMESQVSEIRKEVVTFDRIVAQSLMAVGYLAEKSGIQIVSDVSPDSEAFADSAGLVQVMVNLLANAVKFSPPGSTITVSARPIEGAVEVKIKDQGRGIPASLQDAIFDRFKQVERADRTEKMGSGLGLSICKSIVEAHGGKIGVTSEEGVGSTFWFLIPVED